MTFPKFFREIDKVAGGLTALGVKKGDVVMVALPNIEQSIVLVYAISKIGAVCSVVHPKLTVSEFQKQVELQKPKVVFLTDINLKNYKKVVSFSKIVYCPFWAYKYIGLKKGGEFQEFNSDGENPTFLMHSGGTSGVPKTVCLSARAVNALTQNLLGTLDADFTEKDAMLASLPIFHGYGMCVGIHSSLCTNMKVVLLPKFSGKSAVKVLKQNKVTTMVVVPRMLKSLLRTDGFYGDSVKFLKNIYVGGDALSLSLEDDFNLRLKGSGSSCEISPGYGLTEVGSVCIVANGKNKKGTVGKALSGVETKIVDENLNEVASGDTGELLLSSSQVMSSYYNDRDLTDKTLIELDGKVWLKTGDYFKIDDEKFLTFMGRKKRLIKISGMNVFPSEIERVAREMPFVSECVALETMIKGKSYIKLIVEGDLKDKEKALVITHISRNLSHWNKPEYVECVKKLPRTNIGKIDFVRLANEYQKY